jgi:hypothetical protein
MVFLLFFKHLWSKTSALGLHLAHALKRFRPIITSLCRRHLYKSPFLSSGVERQVCPNNPGSHRSLPPRERMAAGSRTNAARPRSRGSPLPARLVDPETNPREAREPREPAHAPCHGPLRELAERAAPRLPLRGPGCRLPVWRRRWRGRTRGSRAACRFGNGARGVGAGAE